MRALRLAQKAEGAAITAHTQKERPRLGAASLMALVAQRTNIETRVRSTGFCATAYKFRSTAAHSHKDAA